MPTNKKAEQRKTENMMSLFAQATVRTRGIVSPLAGISFYMLNFLHLRPSGHQLKLERYRED
jgi:hypothetical protein